MNKNEALAKDLYKWCVKNGLWFDCCVYFNGKAWATWSEWHGENGKKIGDGLYEYGNKDPLKYCEYANPSTITMTFEGPLYRMLNGDVRGWVKLEDQFSKLFNKYGLYYEMDYAWSLSAYEI